MLPEKPSSWLNYKKFGKLLYVGAFHSQRVELHFVKIAFKDNNTLSQVSSRNHK